MLNEKTKNKKHVRLLPLTMYVEGHANKTIVLQSRLMWYTPLVKASCCASPRSRNMYKYIYQVQYIKLPEKRQSFAKMCLKPRNVPEIAPRS